MNEMVQQFDLLGVRISAINMEGACSFIAEAIEKKNKGYICVCPVSTVVECRKDERFRRIVNAAALVTPDGMPTVWLGRFKGHKDIRRVYGPDLVLAVCAMSEKKGYRHYFYGATPETCRLLESRLKEKFPALNIAGSYAPPFRELTQEEDERIVGEINRLRPDVVWVGLGSPKQDFWMHDHSVKLNASILAGVGAAFDFLSGAKKQAPRWMQRVGLEWFFRLCCEPARLWRRYLVGNPRFVYYLLQDSLRQKSGK